MGAVTPKSRRQTFQEFYLPKILYFVLYLASGCTAAYNSIFFANVLNFSSQELGYIMALSPFISFIACPLWSAISDKTCRHKLIMIACSLSSNCINCLLPLLRPSFPVAVLITVVASFCGAAVGSLFDVLVLERMIPSKDLYGKQRLWGAIGMGIAGPLAGAVIEKCGTTSAIYFLALLWSTLFCCIVFVTIKDGPRKGPNYSEIEGEGEGSKEDIPTEAKQVYKEPFLVQVRKFFTPSYALFLITTLLFGMHLAVISTFEYIFLSEYLHASSILLGAIPPFAVAMELPFFFFAKPILHKLGTKKMLVIAQVTAIVRVMLYVVLYESNASPWFVLPLDLLHGVSFAFFWAAAVHFATHVAPEGLEATSQGVLNGCYGGFGYGVGNIVAGSIYPLGPVILWSSVACVVFIGMLVFPMTSLLVERIRDKTPPSVSAHIPAVEFPSEFRTRRRTATKNNTLRSVSFTSPDVNVISALENMDLD